MRILPRPDVPAFIIDLTSLLVLGPHPAVLVAGARSVVLDLSRGLGRSGFKGRLSLLLRLACVMTAVQAAAFAFAMFPSVPSAWPWRAIPVAAALAAYCLVANLWTSALIPLLLRERVNRSWPKQLLDGAPAYVIGATVAVAITAIIDQRMWQITPAAAVPLYFAYRAHAAYVRQKENGDRREEILEWLDTGICTLDASGRVLAWNEAAARIFGAGKEQVIGRSLFTAVPVLGHTSLQKAIKEAVADGGVRTLERLQLPGGSGARVLQIRIVPAAGRVTVVWHDLTERVHTEGMLKRSEERLALAAEGANDGLWEWDLRTQEFYYSGRWRAMVGIEPPFDVGRPEDWLGRVHPDDLAALKEALDAHLAGATERLEHEHRLRHEDGSYGWFLCRGVAVRGSGGRAIRLAGSLTDRTEQAKTQEQLRIAAFVDPLTGLCNRTVFVEGLGKRLEEFKRRPHSGRFAVLYLDLDRFKIVNDSLGHLVGDELLVAVSRRLESCLRQGDALARLGGDEFAILLNGLSSEQQANAIAFRIQAALNAPFSIGGREVFTSASIGIACAAAQYTGPDELMRDADTAMYHAKSHGKARHELFDADMHARTRDRLGLENDLRRAAANRDFQVCYQPIVSLSSGMCVGFESLVRWTRNGEVISPAIFIPIAEELGLIEPIGTFVLQEACRTFAGWQRRYPDSTLDCITVNASSRQLMQQNFLFTVEQAVHSAGLKPANLRIEITETALMESPGEAAEVLRELRNFGAKIYLDDFGTGYSSLSHLHKLPVDALKIDRSFVRSLLNPDRPAIVESILALARTLNTSVVAEGIETEVEASELERLGCTHAQGYLFAKPLSKRDAEKVIAANLPLGPKALPVRPRVFATVARA